jgi:hypothetical protein
MVPSEERLDRAVAVVGAAAVESTPIQKCRDREVVVELALSPASLVKAPPALAEMEGAWSPAAVGPATRTVEGELSAEMEETSSVPMLLVARPMVISLPSWRQAVEGPAVVSTTIWASVAVAEVEAAEPSNSAQYRL